ncbi:regulator of chromosome condensation 1/beta-lactamase-inhibitor protein II [Haematococcus lacustris]
MKKVRTSCSGSSPQGTDRQDDDGSTSSPRRSKRLAYKTPFWSPASAASTEVSQPHSINLLAGQCSQQPSSCGPPSLALTDDKPSVASTFQLSFSTAATGLASFRDTDRCGLWGVLPEELVEVILRQCTPPQLGMLESTCSHFRHNKLIEKIAKQKLKLVPRARGLRPNKKESESYVMLLQYVTCQSQAAAQATSVACGAYHTSALLVPSTIPGARHSLHMFGRGFHGQLGNDHFVSQKAPVVVSLGFKSCQDNSELEEETMPAVVACGAHHSSSISRKGELYSWGLGCNGELGLGRWSPIELALPRQCSSPHMRVVSVACGANHTLAIAETGTLWSCGRNRHGQLGTNTLVDGSRLQMVLHLGGYRIVSAAAGSAHSLALASDGSLFTWGDGSHGQLGHSQLQHIAAMMPANNPITMPSAQKISRLDPASLSPDNRVTAISAGAHHSIALTVGGAILSFGANSMGQLGTGDLQDRWKPTRVPLALPEEGQPCLRVVQLACGAAHSVALFSNQGSLEVRTAGCNAYGQLGHGDRSSRCLFTPVPRIPNVVAVQAGDEHSCAITTAGELFLWGRGDSGQLGMGDMRAKWKPTLLKDYQVVHPDKTLRRNKRNQPFTRSVARDGESGPSLIM